MDSKVVAVVAVIVIAVVAVGIYAAMDHGDELPDYQYEVLEVKIVEYPSGLIEYRAPTDFYPALSEGVHLTMTYKGIPIGETETKTDGVTHLDLIIYPTVSMSLEDIKENMVIVFS